MDAAIHTDAAEVSYVGTLHTEDMRPGISGELRSHGIWSCRDRAQSTTLRELRPIRCLLLGRLWQHLMEEYKSELLLHVKNLGGFHITNSFVSARRPMMRGLGRLKVVLDRLGICIRVKWIPSAANKFADTLSRRLAREYLQVQKKLRRSVLTGMKARDVFKYRPLGEHPVLQRPQAYHDQTGHGSRGSRAGATVGQGRSSSSVTARRPHRGYRTEVGDHEGPSSAAHPGLEAPTRGNTDSVEDHENGESSLNGENSQYTH